MHIKCKKCKCFQKYQECEFFLTPQNCSEETVKLRDNLNKEIKEDIRMYTQLTQQGYDGIAAILGKCIEKNFESLRLLDE